MKIAKTAKFVFAELTKESDRYSIDAGYGKLSIKGEHRIKLFLNQTKEPPWRTTVLFFVHEPMVEIFNEFAEDRYQVESESDGRKRYLVMDGCQSRKEFIDTMLEAIIIMDKAVMASRIGILCDSDERHG